MCCSALDNSWRQCWTKKKTKKKNKKKTIFCTFMSLQSPQKCRIMPIPAGAYGQIFKNQTG